MGRNPPSLKLRQQNGNSSNMPRREPKKEAPKKVPQPVRKTEKETASLLYPGGDTAFKALLSARFCSAIWCHITDCDETYNYWEPMHYLVSPGGDTAFKALLSARFCSAIWCHITDCDETYNYWEPMHYLVFGKGLQTWEYSPEYALRSYTYIMLHAAPAYLYHKLIQPNPLLIFYLIKCVLGLLCSFAEVYFYKAVCREFGVHIGRIWLGFQLFSAGMFISSSAFLPSTFAMYTFTGSCAAWWMQKYPLAIFMTALGSLLGWPFAALLGVPIAIDMLFKRKMYKDFIQWSAISAVVIMVPMILIDSSYYGKLVVAPWNIVRYNIFGGAGPNLYGTEPFTFYLLNGFVNFNFIWVFSLLCPILLLLQYLFVPTKNRITLCLPHYISLSPLYLWLAVFMLQAHKEERFLFPVYPMICLSGAIAVDITQKLAYRIWCIFKSMPPGAHYLDYTLFMMIITVIVSSLMGVSRIFALYNNYHAPLDLLMELNRYPAEGRIANNVAVNVCLGKEWHRYPSSFFLPNKNWNIRIIKSEFSGMIPAPYTESDNGTLIVHKHFNDKNLEEPNLYFNITKCHFLLDLDLGVETELEPNYANMKDKWKLVKSLLFLNSDKSHSFFRAFYVPFLTNKYVQYGNYNLLQTVKPKRS